MALMAVLWVVMMDEKMVDFLAGKCIESIAVMMADWINK